MAQVAAISQQIWDMKYRLKGPDGAPVDKTIEDSWRRVASALAEAEEPEGRAAWTEATPPISRLIHGWSTRIRNPPPAGCPRRRSRSRRIMRCVATRGSSSRHAEIQWAARSDSCSSRRISLTRSA